MTDQPHSVIYDSMEQNTIYHSNTHKFQQSYKSQHNKTKHNTLIQHHAILSSYFDVSHGGPRGFRVYDNLNERPRHFSIERGEYRCQHVREPMGLFRWNIRIVIYMIYDFYDHE